MTKFALEVGIKQIFRFFERTVATNENVNQEIILPFVFNQYVNYQFLVATKIKHQICGTF
jgi:hypothetical protein